MKKYIYINHKNLNLNIKFYKSMLNEIGNIIYVPGGGFLYSSNEDLPQGHIDKFTGQGYNIFSISYRLCPESDISDSLKDVLDAFIFILENQDKFNLKTNTFFAWGRSAGSYIILKILEDNFWINKQISAFISFYGYGFLLNSWAHKSNNYYQDLPKISKDMAKKFTFSGEIANIGINQRYALYLYARQSGNWLKLLSDYNRDDFYNIYKVDSNKIKNIAPTLLVHNKNDYDVPYEESVKLSQYISNSELLLLDTDGHAFDNDSQNSKTSMVLDLSFSFLDKYS